MLPTAMWLVTRDVSQRVEPDARPLGRAVSAFIAERTRRLSTLLTGDVPPQHLMRPVHFAGRRRQGHPADGVSVQSIIKQCAVLRGALCPSSLIQEASPARRYYADLGCQDARRLLQQRTLVAPSTTSIMFLGPHVGPQYPCTCPPLVIKGEACNATRERSFTHTPSLRQRDLDSQLPSFHNNPTHNGVGYYAPAARTTLNPRVFMCSVSA
jgi:hypothetical protein